MSYYDDEIAPNLHKTPNRVDNTRQHSPTVSSDMSWRGADGKTTIGEMDDNHLRNSHALLGRRIGTALEKVTDHPYYGWLRAEINRRGIA